MNESILITGANAGLGKEAARQLALKDETRKVILFCRNRAKAEAAKKELEAETGKKIFEIVIGDVADANSVRKAVENITEPRCRHFECRRNGGENCGASYAFGYECFGGHEYIG